MERQNFNFLPALCLHRGPSLHLCTDIALVMGLVKAGIFLHVFKQNVSPDGLTFTSSETAAYVAAPLAFRDEPRRQAYLLPQEGSNICSLMPLELD